VSPDEEDEEALSWAGGRDPSHYETPVAKPGKGAKSSTHPEAAVPDGAGDTDHGGETDDDADQRAPMSAIVLVCLGVLGGIYALYTLGWFLSWQRLLYADPDELEFQAFHVQQVLAILAAPLWFGATIYFTRGRKSAGRLLWLVIGALALIPWSFTFGQ
jgi:hypothetical protein